MSEEQAAAETKGVTAELLATVDLGPELEGMAGRQLRMRIGDASGVLQLKDRRFMRHVGKYWVGRKVYDLWLPPDEIELTYSPDGDVP